MSEAPPASEHSPMPEPTLAKTPAIGAPVAVPSAKELRGREREKTPEQRAEDVAYTINHAVSCATTDIFIAPTISALPSILKGNQKFNFGLYMNEASGYLKGEIIGDFSAVPLTIMVQRFFPSFMELVGRIIDPVAKPIFHHGAETAAVRWGKKHGFSANDNEVVDRAEQIYQHEIQHLPQAVVWNMFSFPLGVIGQMMTGPNDNWKEIARGKLLGTAISNILLIGVRALLPDKAEKFDRMDGKYVIRPATRALSGLVGIDKKTVDHMEQKAEAEEQRENGTWRTRVRDKAANTNSVSQVS